MTKDFTNITAGRVQSTIAAATQDTQEIHDTPATQEAHKTQRKNKPRKTYTDQEAAAYAQDLRTSGRKGMQLPRVNLALAPDMYEYLRAMSKGAGMTYTEFIDTILRKHKAEHTAEFKQVMKIRKSL